jgi:FAM192A/Fyv6, N-terminal domain
VLADAKQAKEDAFQAQWKQMKTGAAEWRQLQQVDTDRTAPDCQRLRLHMSAASQHAPHAGVTQSRRSRGEQEKLRQPLAHCVSGCGIHGSSRPSCHREWQTAQHWQGAPYSDCPPAGKNRPLDEDELDFLDTLQQQTQHADAAWRAEQERELDAYQQVGDSALSALQASPFMQSRSASWTPTSRWAPYCLPFQALL